ncbi:hypothetical protein EYF80_029039 [Liparis tanakae]|uniref:Uncharacterized protein n=1 Tax=Liparis tanakae TaxID=230148 RepID=A0A4Z2H635_9TELE|nr:hypothetical protein EYF80_029039 [Liparis tanakae]
MQHDVRLSPAEVSRVPVLVLVNSGDQESRRRPTAACRGPDSGPRQSSTGRFGVRGFKLKETSHNQRDKGQPPEPFEAAQGKKVGLVGVPLQQGGHAAGHPLVAFVDELLAEVAVDLQGDHAVMSWQRAVDESRAGADGPRWLCATLGCVRGFDRLLICEDERGSAAAGRQRGRRRLAPGVVAVQLTDTPRAREPGSSGLTGLHDWEVK